jgi:hypothetical protein
MTRCLTEELSLRWLCGLESARGPTNHRFFYRRHDEAFEWEQLPTMRRIWIINVWDHFTRDAAHGVRGRISWSLWNK